MTKKSGLFTEVLYKGGQEFLDTQWQEEKKILRKIAPDRLHDLFNHNFRYRYKVLHVH